MNYEVRQGYKLTADPFPWCVVSIRGGKTVARTRTEKMAKRIAELLNEGKSP